MPDELGSDQFSPAPSKTNTLAIVAFILAFLMPLVGLILGIIALNQIKKDPSQGGRGLAVASIILSVIFMVLFILLFVLSMFLAYFGVLNPNTMLPSRCTLPTGFSCSNFVVGSSGEETIKIQLLNGLGRGIIITDFTATPTDGNPAKGVCTASLASTYNGASNVLYLANGDSQTVTLTCPGSTISRLKRDPETKYRWQLEFDYYTEDTSPDYKKTIMGELFSSVG